MKSKGLMTIGIIIIVFVLISPFPPLLGISGLFWRVAIGLMGLAVAAIGIYNIVKKN